MQWNNFTLVILLSSLLSCSFRFRGIVRNSCITEGDPEDRLWCSVEVDGRGDHVIGKGRFGHCDCSLDRFGRKCKTVSLACYLVNLHKSMSGKMTLELGQNILLQTFCKSGGLGQ